MDTLMLLLADAGGGPLPVWLKEGLDALMGPITYTVLVVLVYIGMMAGYRYWTKPWVAGSLLAGMTLFFILAYPDLNFRKIVSKPDNIPIVSLLFVLGFFTWWAFRQAAINDERIEKGKPTQEGEEAHDRVLTWPDLIYTELICSVIFTFILVIWGIGIDAPLEEPATAGKTPNPSKAPWYFLGLQEMLVYFDPWIAGVLLPTMIITGLMVIPFCDKNPKGVGYYTIKERPFAVWTYMFGFVVLWVSLIFMGTFLRGPNWNFFGIFESWDVHKLEAMPNVNVSEHFWITFLGMALPTEPLIREAPGIALTALYLFLAPPLLAFGWIPFIGKYTKQLYQQTGFMRYNIMMIHVLVMIGMVVKMILRWVFNLKYIVYIPEWFFNI